MPGSIFPNINPAVTSGNQLATLLNDFRDIVISGFSGNTRPTGLLAGGYWVDTTNGGSPTFYWDVKLWTGTADVTVYRVNLATNTVSIAGANDLFTIEKVSADNSGPILKFLKERIANSGQVLTGDVVGAIEFFSAANDDSNPLVARFRAVAIENATDTEQGTALVIEATSENSASIVEIARFVNRNFGIGTTTPQARLDVVLSGAGEDLGRFVKLSEDALGPKVAIEKQRAAGVQAIDLLGALEFRGRDSVGNSSLGATIEAFARQNFTATQRGSELAFSVVKDGETIKTLIAVMSGERTEFFGQVFTGAKAYSQVDEPAALEILALPANDGIVRITGAGATDLKGIDATGLSKVLIVHNASDSVVTIVHESLDALAADRIKLPNGVDVRLEVDQSIEFFYDSIDNLWKLKSGSGLGGGGGITVVADLTARDAIIPEERFEGMLVYVVSNQTNYQLVGGILNANYQVLGREVVSVQNALTAAGTASLNLVAPKQTIVVSGSGGAVTLAAAAFGATAPLNGAEIILIGGSDTNSVRINRGTGAKEVSINGDFVELFLHQSITLKYISSLDIYIEIARSH